MIIYKTIIKVNGNNRLNLGDMDISCRYGYILSKLNSIKIDVQGNNSVHQAWESLNTKIDSETSFSVEERTMSSRDLVKELTQINLNARNPQNITRGTILHDQKMSNLCVYFATLSALRHEIKNIFNNLISKAVDTFVIGVRQVSIPAGKSIDQLLEEKEFDDPDPYSNEKIPNALSFERMLSVLLGCVSPRALSGKGKNLIN